MGTLVYIGLAVVVLAAVAYLFWGPGSGAKAPAKASAKPSAKAASATPATDGERDDEEVVAKAREKSLPPAGNPRSSNPDLEVGGGYADGPEEGEDTGTNPWILVTAVGRSDPGLKRKHNEDSYLVLDDHQLFVVADGMGRHAAGEVASRMATDTVAAAFATGDFGDRPLDPKLSKEANRLKATFHLANEEVFLKSQAEDAYHGMGTTMVAVHFSKNKERAAIAHAGDSRCYRLRDRKLEQLTTDHTLGAAGIVGPSASVLSKAIGIEENLEPDVMVDKPQPGDVYLICSDGLSRMASNDEITEILLGNRDLEKACAGLIDRANAAGGRDNVTVILVRVDRTNMHA
jgi:protein phosphatase